MWNIIIKYTALVLPVLWNSKWSQKQVGKVTEAAQEVASDWIDDQIQRARSQELADYYRWLNEERRRKRGKFELFPEWSVQTRVLRAVFD